ncbi:MAG: triphosphoribosyl-dephospho-CoA synthase [Gemmataceae bacterium]
MLTSVGLYCQLACIWEATARKAGNVHRLRDFDDLTYLDFIQSAAAIGPVFDRVPPFSVGKTVLESIRETRRFCRTNTNLGIVILLAPLAAVPLDIALATGVENVLEHLTLQDACAAFEAIRLANPGGLERVPDQDVRREPTVPLRQAMLLAADRDLVARQYANGYREVLHEGVPALQQALSDSGSLETAIVVCHLSLLAVHGDSLIARKCGKAVSEEAAHRAAEVLGCKFPHSETGKFKFHEFDAWLRGDGHRRNPGTTADLTAACLFAALREGIIELPLRYTWAGGF